MIQIALLLYTRPTHFSLRNENCPCPESLPAQNTLSHWNGQLCGPCGAADLSSGFSCTFPSACPLLRPRQGREIKETAITVRHCYDKVGREVIKAPRSSYHIRIPTCSQPQSPEELFYGAPSLYFHVGNGCGRYSTLSGMLTHRNRLLN